jgi:hypothetical protein
MKSHLRYSDITRIETDQSVINTLIRKGWEVYEPEPVVETYPTFTAEKWLDREGYTPLRLLTCLDIEGKLNAAGKASPKLSAVRQWLDSITVYVASNPVESRYDWGAAPFQFDQVLSEALTIINS